MSRAYRASLEVLKLFLEAQCDVVIKIERKAPRMPRAVGLNTVHLILRHAHQIPFAQVGPLSLMKSLVKSLGRPA